MEQTASKTEPDSLEDKESIYESPPELTGFSPQDAEDYPTEAEDPVIDGKLVEHAGNIRAKKYSKITDEQRRDFINAVENNGEKIIHAAKRFDINYSSAKSILNVFKSEGRSIKKQFRDKSHKNQKYFQEGSESSLGKSPASGEKRTVGDKVPITNNASTQTMDDPEEGENSLLVLRDRLLASKTDKRQNPYEGLSSHEFTRFSGSLNDYSESQLTFDPSNSNRGGGQVFNLGGNSNQNFMGQQNMSRPDSMGYGNVPPNYQFFQVGGGSNMQSSPPIYQQQQPQYIQGFQGGQVRPSQFSAAGGSDFSKASSFEGPPRQQEGQNFGSMIYTGVNPVQYFVMNPNDQMRGMQMGQQQQPQYQFLQPIMYVMPTASQNVSIPSNMNQPYIPQPNGQIIYNPSNDSGQNHKGGSPNFPNQYPNMK